jgi:hypothetical protein
VAVAINVRYVLFTNAVAWSYDYGTESRAPRSSRRRITGDSEKIFRAAGRRGHTLPEWVQTSAHDGTPTTPAWSVRDRSCNRGSIRLQGGFCGTQLLCDTIRFSGDRVIVQASEDKHACTDDRGLQRISLIWDIWGENCGWNPSTIPIISLWWKEKDFLGDRGVAVQRVQRRRSPTRGIASSTTLASR